MPWPAGRPAKYLVQRPAEGARQDRRFANLSIAATAGHRVRYGQDLPKDCERRRGTQGFPLVPCRRCRHLARGRRSRDGARGWQAHRALRNARRHPGLQQPLPPRGLPAIGRHARSRLLAHLPLAQLEVQPEGRRQPLRGRPPARVPGRGARRQDLGGHRRRALGRQAHPHPPRPARGNGGQRLLPHRARARTSRRHRRRCGTRCGGRHRVVRRALRVRLDARVRRSRRLAGTARRAPRPRRQANLHSGGGRPHR